MTLRDDMVFRPTLGPDAQPTAKTRAREERQHDLQHRKGGALRRLRLARQMRRRQRRIQQGKSQSKIRGARMVGRSGLARAASGLAGTVRGGAARAVLLNPITAAIAGLVAGGIVLFRLGSGKTFEQMGDELNNIMIGDLDEAGRARMTVRHRFQGDALMTRIRSQSGKQNMQMNRIAEDLFRVEKQYEDGKALIEREFGVNGTWDMLILRAYEAFGKAWKAIGGSDKLSQFVTKSRKHQIHHGKARSSR